MRTGYGKGWRVMQRGLLAGLGLVLVAGVFTPVVTPVEVDSVSAAVASSAMPFDFDGDGYADLAVGIPREDLRGKRDAGAVQVLYGSASGVTDHDEIWHQRRKGVKGALEKDDLFGSALASADFDGDGYADLAIGIPGEDIGRKKRAGAVQVLYGGPRGLTAAGDQVWHQGKRGVPGTNEKWDNFGNPLTSGDFDGDGFDDLAVGVLFEDVAPDVWEDSGAVVVLRGSASGLTAAGAARFRQGARGVAGNPTKWGRFGTILAAGDVNGDGRDDLAVLVHDLRAVHLLLGGANTLVAAGGLVFGLPDLGVQAASIADMTLSDFNRDGFADLALSFDDASRLAVLHGHADGLHPVPLPEATTPGVDAVRTLGSEGKPNATLAAGDLTGDGYPDLAVEHYGPISVILGTASGLGPAIAKWPVSGDEGGMRVLPFSGGGHMWLAVGRTADQVGPDTSAGTVTVVQGTATGAAGPVATWNQDSPRIKNAAESGDSFGTLRDTW